MSYEVLEKQIRALPEEALEDVSNYLDKIRFDYAFISLNNLLIFLL